MNYIERMEKELEELQAKILAGGSFLSKEIDGDTDILNKEEVCMLGVQLTAMCTYADALESRILIAKSKEEKNGEN